MGYRPIGIRIDSGDLAYQSIVAFEIFTKVAQAFNLEWFPSLTIIVSNDINEETIISLNEQKHRINALGIGTHLVTCQKQPALGCVYKVIYYEFFIYLLLSFIFQLVEVNTNACIKLSQDVEKVTIPSRKNVYRIYGKEGYALVDLMTNVKQPKVRNNSYDDKNEENGGDDDECAFDEEEPKVGEKILCRHPFLESKRCYVTPTKVEKLLQVWWANGEVCVYIFIYLLISLLIVCLCLFLIVATANSYTVRNQRQSEEIT